MTSTPEKGNTPETKGHAVETVRCILRLPDGCMLLLQKGRESKKAAFLWEFPGGKIDVVAGDTSTVEEQWTAVLDEVSQETGINLAEMKLPQPGGAAYSYNYDIHHGETTSSRTVHMFVVQLSEEPKVAINQTKGADGLTEDKHGECRWLTLEQIHQMNEHQMLLGNSIHYREALG